MELDHPSLISKSKRLVVTGRARVARQSLCSRYQRNIMVTPYAYWDGSSSARPDSDTYRTPDGSDWKRIVAELRSATNFVNSLLGQIVLDSDLDAALAQLQNQLNGILAIAVIAEANRVNAMIADLQSQISNLQARIFPIVMTVHDNLSLTDATTFVKELHHLTSSVLILVSNVAINKDIQVSASSAMVLASSTKLNKSIQLAASSVLALVGAVRSRAIFERISSALSLSQTVSVAVTHGP